MTRFALWGGGRRYVQIGSIEDRRICAQRKRVAAFRLAVNRLSAAIRQMGEAFATLGASLRKAMGAKA